jgi:hypothetical protein
LCNNRPRHPPHFPHQLQLPADCAAPWASRASHEHLQTGTRAGAPDDVIHMNEHDVSVEVHTRAREFEFEHLKWLRLRKTLLQ